MGKKLFLAIIIIVLITLLLSMLSVNLVFTQQFSSYLTRTTEATLEQLPARLSSVYQSKGFWDPAALDNISQTLPFGTQITLNDPKGKLIANLVSPMDAMHMQYGISGMDSMMNMGMPYSVQDWKTKTMTIKGKDTATVIATAVIRYPSSARILNPEDRSFMSAIFRSILLAGILALLIGILLGYFTSRHLVSPLQHLTKAAYRIGQGHLDERVKLTAKDEVGQLASAFNSMADNLQKQENLRKQFTADIAHELRTPLTSIRSYIEAFQDGVMPADSENLMAINEEIERLVSMATDLKDLNVAEMGALQPNLSQVDLTGLFGKVIQNINPLLNEKKLSLEWNPPRQNVTIEGDPRLLTRLFYNLIHNAYKYTEAGGKITITLRPFTTLTDFVEIEVQDTGIGIPEADLPNIFERFYRTDKSRARETGGTGIGLALVRQIATLHHGTVSVESRIGQGTTFTVRLPKGEDILEE